MVKFIAKEMLAKDTPALKFSPDFDLRKVSSPGRDGVIAEFVGTGDFAAEWKTRQYYEVTAGRDAEPLLYTSLYSILQDANLPEIIDIFQFKQGGVVFEEVLEGGEAKFVTIETGDITARIRQFAVALEYSKKLRMYNQTWNVSIVERQVGVAHNALLNHLHFYPILSYAYTAANQTAAASGQGGLLENVLATIENGITNSKADTTNPRKGPYNLVIAGADMFKIERALNRVPQTGFSKQSSALEMIQNVIVYDGWTGTRGKKATTYAGVTANTAYLVNAAYKDEDFRSFVKQPLEAAMGNADVSRFIEEQTVWDVHLGVYSNPAAAVEELTLPTSGA